MTVRRTGGAAGAASVDFMTTVDSVVNAADAADFTPVSGTLTWGDGDASDRTITIQLADDSKAEDGEVFGLLLSGASGAPLAPNQMVIIIQDDEPPGPRPPRPDVTAPPSSDSGGGAFDWLLLVVLAGACFRKLLGVTTSRHAGREPEAVVSHSVFLAEGEIRK